MILLKNQLFSNPLNHLYHNSLLLIFQTPSSLVTNQKVTQYSQIHHQYCACSLYNTLTWLSQSDSQMKKNNLFVLHGKHSERCSAKLLKGVPKNTGRCFARILKGVLGNWWEELHTLTQMNNFLVETQGPGLFPVTSWPSFLGGQKMKSKYWEWSHL